jgi:hypothetical protein
VKITRLALIEAIDAQVEHAQQKYETEAKEYEYQKELAVARWYKNEFVQLQELRDLLDSRLHEDQPPLTMDEVREVLVDRNYLNLNDLTFSGARRVGEPRVPNFDSLLALKALLEASPDEFVTTSNLADLGWRNIEGLLRAAVTAEQAKQARLGH